MFEEKNVTKYGEYYVKVYKTDKDIFDVLETIVYSDIPYVIVMVREDQDVGFKFYNGDYPKDEFLQKYNDMKFEASDYTFVMNNGDNIRIFTDSNIVFLESKNENADLNNIFNVHVTKK